jgi:hypothetical protein
MKYERLENKRQRAEQRKKILEEHGKLYNEADSFAEYELKVAAEGVRKISWRWLNPFKVFYDYKSLGCFMFYLKYLGLLDAFLVPAWILEMLLVPHFDKIGEVPFNCSIIHVVLFILIILSNIVFGVYLNALGDDAYRNI